MPGSMFVDRPPAAAALTETTGQGATTVRDMMDAGLPQSQVLQWRDQQVAEMTKAGLQPDAIDQYWGIPKVAATPIDSLKAGWESSVTGLIANQQAPDIIPAQHMDMLHSILFQTGQTVGDIPAMVAGAVGGAAAGTVAGEAVEPIGGGLVGATAGLGAGAFAVPTSLRQALMTSFSYQGGPVTAKQVWSDLASNVINTGKAALTGASAALAGEGAGAAAAAGGMLVKTAASATTQALTATTVGAALQGHLPDAQDLVTGTILTLGLGIGGHVVGAMDRVAPTEAGEDVAKNMSDIYVQTGAHPVDVGRAASKDIAVKNEVLAPYAPDGTRVTPLIDQKIAPVTHEQDLEAHMDLQKPLEGMTLKPLATGGATSFSYAIKSSSEGQVGHIIGIIKNGVLQIGHTEIFDDRDKGKSYASNAYSQIVDWAHSQGIEVRSDKTVSPEAEQLYGSLARKGYEVTRNSSEANSVFSVSPKVSNSVLNRSLTIMGDDGKWMPPEGEAAPAREQSGGGGGKGPPAIPGREQGAAPEGEPPPSEAELEDRIHNIIATPEKAKSQFWTNVRKTIYQFQGKLAPAEKLDQQIKLAPGEYGVQDFMRQTFGSASRALHFIRFGGLKLSDKTFAWEPDETPSWMEAYNKVKENGGTVKGFVAYRLAKRTIEKAQQGITTGTNLQDAIDFVKTPGVEAKYEEASRMIQANKDNSIDYAINAGVFSKEMGQAIKDLNKEHIIYRRIFDPAYKPSGPGQAFSPRQPTKQMTGVSAGDNGEDTYKIADPVTSEIDNLHTIIAMADRNIALRGVMGLISTVPKLMEDLGIRQVPTIGHNGGPDLEDWDQDTPLSEIPSDIKGALNPFLQLKAANARMQDGDFAYFEDGKLRMFHVDDPVLASMFRASYPAEFNPLMSILEKVAKVQRTGIVGEPDFAFRAALHGQFAAMINAEHGSFPLHDILTGLMDTVKQGPAYQEFARNGGLGAVLNDIGKTYIEQDIAKAFEETDTLKQGWNVFSSPAQAMRAVSHMIDTAARSPWKIVSTLNRVSHTLDTAARVGYMKRTMKAGVTPAKAANEANTAYLDHREGFGGEWVNSVARTIPFFSVGVKDVLQTAGAARANPLRWATRGFAALGGATVIMSLIHHYQDQFLPPGQRYKDQSRWARDHYLYLPRVNGVFHKIPMPYNVGYLFHTVPERIMDRLLENDPHAFDGMASEFMQQFLMPLMPPLLAPIEEQYANKTYFGTPLIPAKFENLSAYMQYGPDQSEVAKKLTQFLGPPNLNIADWSPIVVDNYIDQWLGPIGMTLTRAMGSPWAPPGSHQMFNDLPFVKSFIARNPTSPQITEDFYTDYDQFQQAHADVVAAAKRGDPDLVNSDQRVMSAVRLQKVAESLHNIETVITAINANPKMTNPDKLKWTDYLMSSMVAISQQGENIMEQYRR